MHCLPTFLICLTIGEGLEFDALLRSLCTCFLVKYTFLESRRWYAEMAELLNALHASIFDLLYHWKKPINQGYIEQSVYMFA